MRVVGGIDRALPSTTEKTLLRVDEAAELLSVSRWTIYRWVEEGRLRGTKIGKGSVRVFHESVLALIARHEHDPSGTRSRSEGV